MNKVFQVSDPPGSPLHTPARPGDSVADSATRFASIGLKQLLDRLIRD
ncbi:hypothetical protein HQ520_00545, partial [bacterium]|nr:hypothetical protein [bacterium]